MISSFSALMALARSSTRATAAKANANASMARSTVSNFQTIPRNSPLVHASNVGDQHTGDERKDGLFARFAQRLVERGEKIAVRHIRAVLAQFTQRADEQKRRQRPNPDAQHLR